MDAYCCVYIFLTVFINKLLYLVYGLSENAVS